MGEPQEALLEAADRAAAELEDAACALRRSGEGASREEARARCVNLLARLRALHWRARHGVASREGAAAREAGRADAETLRQQSLAYERVHLGKEVRALRASIPGGGRASPADLAAASGLALPAERTFREEAPERAEAAGDDPRRVVMARLAHELSERRRLGEVAEAKRRQRDEAGAQRDAKRRTLRGLGERVRALYAEATAVAADLGPRPGAVDPPDPRASALPPPLYTLYHAASSHARDDPDASVALRGTVPEVAVVFAVGGGVALHFAMAPGGRADAVAVRAEGAGLDAAGSRALLRHLYPDDGGDDLGVGDAGDGAAAYLWAQRACGLHHAHPRRHEAAVPSAAALARRVRERVRARAALAAESKELAAGRLPPPDGAGAGGKGAASSRMTKFETIDEAVFLSTDAKARAEPGAPPRRWWLEGARYFRAHFESAAAGVGGGGLQMHVYVAVPCEHPARPPLCRVLLERSQPPLQASDALRASSNAAELAAALERRLLGFNAHSAQIERALNAAAPGPASLTRVLARCPAALDAYAAGTGLVGRDRRLPL